MQKTSGKQFEAKTLISGREKILEKICSGNEKENSFYNFYEKLKIKNFKLLTTSLKIQPRLMSQKYYCAT